AAAALLPDADGDRAVAADAAAADFRPRRLADFHAGVAVVEDVALLQDGPAALVDVDAVVLRLVVDLARAQDGPSLPPHADAGVAVGENVALFQPAQPAVADVD